MQWRIVRSGGRVRAVGCPAIGASRYVARTVLAAMHHDGGLRAALNVRYSKDVLKDMGLAVASFDRAHEPGGVSTMEWGTRTAIDTYHKLHNRVADVVYDLGAVSKEHMIRVLVHRAVDAAVLGVEIEKGWRKRKYVFQVLFMEFGYITADKKIIAIKDMNELYESIKL